MQIKIWQKSMGVFLAICFSMGLITTPVSAKPQGASNHMAEQNHNNHEKNKKFEHMNTEKKSSGKYKIAQATVLSELVMPT